MQSYEKNHKPTKKKGLQKCANHHLHTFANKSPLTTPVFHISYPRTSHLVKSAPRFLEERGRLLYNFFKNSFSREMSFTPGEDSKRELRSMPANWGWWKAFTRSASSGPMPPLRRKGISPS